MNKKYLQNIMIAAVWLVLWYGLDRFISNEILFVGPAETAQALVRLARTPEFYISILSTLARVALGFLAGAAAGIAIAALGYRFRAVGAFISPAVMVLKSTPVASFVILLLIWAGNRNLSMIICFLVVFPIMYLSTRSGLMAVDEKLLEMAQVFRMPWKSRVRGIYVPALRPSLVSAMSLSLGMSWKSGVAAEVIGQPLHTIGNALYRSKIFFETADVFAWTAVVIALSWMFEKLVRRLLRRVGTQAYGSITAESSTVLCSEQDSAVMSRDGADSMSNRDDDGKYVTDTGNASDKVMHATAGKEHP